MQPPDELRDGSRGANWLNKLLAFVKSTRLVEGVGYELNQTTRGVSLVIRPGKGGGGSQLFRVKEIGADWLRCRTCDGTDTTENDGETDIYVARDPELRRTRFDGKTIAYSSDGDSFSAVFAYTSATRRTKTISGTAETQVIIPYYKTDLTIITAVRASTGVTNPEGGEIGWQELTQRAWAKMET